MLIRLAPWWMLRFVVVVDGLLKVSLRFVVTLSADNLELEAVVKRK
jgi:hypothetical protein